MSDDMLRIVMIGFAKLRGNHIITITASIASLITHNTNLPQDPNGHSDGSFCAGGYGNGTINSCLACSHENTLKLSLPLRASEVTYGSEVHFVSEVSPVGEVVGNLNFTASFCEQLHCV